MKNPQKKLNYKQNSFKNCCLIQYKKIEKNYFEKKTKKI